DADRAAKAGRVAVARGLRAVDRNRAQRDKLVARYGNPPQRPWIYLIVATGDIDEDVVQAANAARAGADIIAVIRSTGQSLLDYLPEGATHHGVAPTDTIQADFPFIRAALGRVS